MYCDKGVSGCNTCWEKLINIPKETPMTPNERLLKAAGACIEKMNRDIPDLRNGVGYQTPWIPLFTELETAVKECEAAETAPLVSDQPCGCPIDWPVHIKGCRKAAIVGPPIDADKLRAAFDELSRGRTASAPALTDQQRKLGLRSLRHVGKDYGSPEYD